MLQYPMAVPLATMQEVGVNHRSMKLGNLFMEMCLEQRMLPMLNR